MKVFLLLLVAATAVLAKNVPEQEITAFGYLAKYGIPQAEKIRKAEEELMNNPLKIVGGSAAAPYQIPWQAGLLINLIGFDGTAVCGASLVSGNRLVTAAHCWFDGQNQAWQFTVVLGSTLLFSGGTRVTSSQVITHPRWLPTLALNDVAVIYLDSPVDFSESIAPIALPSGDDVNNNFAGTQGVASGFGLTLSGSITTAQYLSYVNLNIITNAVCRFAFPLFVTDSNICTSGVGGTSTCQGDSGGPLVVKNSNNEDILVGITSFGSALGCSSGFPAAFARVTSFLDFINENI